MTLRSRAFEAVACISRAVSGADDPDGLDLLLRALEFRRYFGNAQPVLDSLTRAVGLFPYLDAANLSTTDLVAWEFHRPLELDDNTVFHRIQAQVYRELLDGTNVVLSAPTSFGKSLIIDAIIASGRYDNIVVVVPTIALIDETRRRLARFRDRFKVITHPSQEPATRNIFVYTQERVVEGLGDQPVDFFVIDEFYKLHPQGNDERISILNHAFYLLTRTGAQFYMLGPNIADIPTGFCSEFKCKFIATDYRTVASQITQIDANGKTEREKELVALVETLSEPTLIYCSSPNRVRQITRSLLSAGIGNDRRKIRPAVRWIGKHYHQDWLFPRGLGRGIGYHHGGLPRALSQLAVAAFNEGSIDTLICTSTLIEGVNTKAKNVIIFDNKVARRKFDYFTFNNIAGRGGRMFQHFVGHVFVFDDPPQEELPAIDIPAFTQSDKASEALLVQLPRDVWTDDSRDRVGRVVEQNILPLSVIRSNHGLEPEHQLSLAEVLNSDPGRYSSVLEWSRMPTYNQLLEICNLIHDHFVRTNQRIHGVSSGRQLTLFMWRWIQQRSVYAMIRAKLADGDEARKGADVIVEETLDFVRHWCSFTFPKYLRALDRIQDHVLTTAGHRPGELLPLASQIENAFLDPAVYALDEYGIPVELGKKLQQWLDPQGDLDVALARLQALEPAMLSLEEFERELIGRAQAGL